MKKQFIVSANTVIFRYGNYYRNILTDHLQYIKLIPVLLYADEPDNLQVRNLHT